MRRVSENMKELELSLYTVDQVEEAKNILLLQVM